MAWHGFLYGIEQNDDPHIPRGIRDTGYSGVRSIIIIIIIIITASGFLFA